MSEFVQAQVPSIVQTIRDHLEGEIQEALNRLQEDVITEQADLHTFQFLLATEGTTADISHIRFRKIEEQRRDLQELLIRYSFVCECLGQQPKVFMPKAEESPDEHSVGLRLV